MRQKVFNRKYVLYAIAHKRNLSSVLALFCYFGQPSGGFFFSRERLTAFFQLPCSFSRSALGPGADFGFARFLYFFLGIVIIPRRSFFSESASPQRRMFMALPGSPNYPAAKSEVEAQTQIVQLLFQILNSLNSLTAELRTTNSRLQHIGSRMH
jgi:hypothetical protein